MISRTAVKKILGTLAVFIALVLILNFDFFWQNLKFTFTGPADEEAPPSMLESNVVIIESLGIEAPIQYVDEPSEDIYQQALQNGVVHFPGTARPGEYGNVYIFGHSSDDAWRPGGYKTIFALLPRIELGAKVIVTDGAGNSHVYAVTDKFVAEAQDTRWLDQRNYEKRLLTLQTSYPIGTALKRYIVIAEIFDPGRSPEAIPDDAS